MAAIKAIIINIQVIHHKMIKIDDQVPHWKFIMSPIMFVFIIPDPVASSHEQKPGVSFAVLSLVLISIACRFSVKRFLHASEQKWYAAPCYSEVIFDIF